MQLSNDLKKMAENMNLFSLSMRCLCNDKTITGKTEPEKMFIRLRDITKTDAMIYLRDIMPRSESFITNVQGFFEYYTTLSYEDWTLCFDDIQEKLNRNRNECRNLIRAHEVMCAALIKRGDEAMELCDHLGQLQNKFEEEIATLDKKSGRYTALTVCASAIGGPIAIPFIIAGVLGASSNLNESLNKSEEKNAVSSISETLSHGLIPAIENFTAGLKAVAGQHASLEADLTNASVGQKKLHYLRTKRKVREVIESCQTFLRMLPAARSNLLSIEN